MREGELLLARGNLLPTRIYWRGCLYLVTRVLCPFFAIFFGLSGAAPRATAQAPGTGAIAGTVSDPSGAAVPNARGTVSLRTTAAGNVHVYRRCTEPRTAGLALRKGAGWRDDNHRHQVEAGGNFCHRRSIGIRGTGGKSKFHARSYH